MRMGSIRAVMAAVLALAAGVSVAQVPQLATPTRPSETSSPPTPASPRVPAPGGATLDKADVDSWLDGYMPYALRTGDIAGAVVVVIKNGQVLTQRGYGFADVAKRRPVDPAATLFRPGSVSKLVTWTAVMQQVEQGKIDLDADVNRYLDFKIPPYQGQPITMRQIMTHTAGFEDHAKGLITFDTKRILPLGAYLKAWVPNRIYAPGTTPAYSNYATAVAGYIVGRVSGMSFDDYVDRNIFAPLGMIHSSFRQPLPAPLLAGMATGYPRASAPASPYEFVLAAPAGSLASTGADMARFMIAHMQDGALGNARILRPETARMMHNTPTTLLPPLNRMELGFFESNVNGHEVIGHLGDTQVFHTALHLFLNDGVGLYLSVNSAGKAGAAGGLRAALLTDFADRYFPATPQDGRVDAKTAAEHARLMAGHWTGSRHVQTGFMRILQLIGQTEVGAGSKGELVISELKNASGAPRQWTEIAPFVWREVNGHERLAAKVVNGRPVRWSVDSEAPFMVFDRTPAAINSAWIMPLLYASLAVLLLTFLYWPVTAVARRRYQAQLAVTGRSRTVYRGVRLASGLVLAMLIAWAVTFSTLLGNLARLTSGITDAVLWLLQIVGLVVFVGAVVLAGWNALLAWREGRRWTRKLWAVLVLIAALTVLYVAFTFGLLDMTVNF